MKKSKTYKTGSIFTVLHPNFASDKEYILVQTSCGEMKLCGLRDGNRYRETPIQGSCSAVLESDIVKYFGGNKVKCIKQARW